MATLLEQSENLKKLDAKTIEQQIFKALKEAEATVLKANIEQLDKGDDSEGNLVGVYAKATEGYAKLEPIPNKPKKEGAPYNFDWTSEFLKGFTLSVSGTEATISSTGVGSGGKRDFLTSNNLFGLNDDNLNTIIQKDILPFINSFARKTLNI